MSNGTGLNQDGSLRAQNIENEDNNAALELHLIIMASQFTMCDSGSLLIFGRGRLSR